MSKEKEEERKGSVEEVYETSWTEFLDDTFPSKPCYDMSKIEEHIEKLKGNPHSVPDNGKDTDPHTVTDKGKDAVEMEDKKVSDDEKENQLEVEPSVFDSGIFVYSPIYESFDFNGNIPTGDFAEQPRKSFLATFLSCFKCKLGENCCKN